MALSTLGLIAALAAQALAAQAVAAQALDAQGAATPPARPAVATEGAQATLQSCTQQEGGGWVCQYKVPGAIYQPAPMNVELSLEPDAQVVSIPAHSAGERSAPAVAVRPPPASARPADAAEAEAAEIAEKEAARQAKLIRRCADASWLSLCLPDDRREAERLKAEAQAREALKVEVGALAADGDCDAAVKKALESGDLALAREMRGFCTTP